MSHEHVVTDSDGIFSIDSRTRVIKNESGKECVVQYDHNSERFTFILPRIIEGHDMLLCNYVEVNYVNTTDGTKGKTIHIASITAIIFEDSFLNSFSSVSKK